MGDGAGRGYREAEGAAEVGAGARHRDRPAVQLDQVADDRQAEAGAAELAARARVRLVEAVPDPIDLVGRHPDAGIDDGDGDQLLALVDSDRDAAVRRGELE